MELATGLRNSGFSHLRQSYRSLKRRSRQQVAHPDNVRGRCESACVARFSPKIAPRTVRRVLVFARLRCMTGLGSCRWTTGEETRVMGCSRLHRQVHRSRALVAQNPILWFNAMGLIVELDENLAHPAPPTISPNYPDGRKPDELWRRAKGLPSCWRICRPLFERRQTRRFAAKHDS
jgi:hypothetical protein